MEPQKRHLFLSEFAYPSHSAVGGATGRIINLDYDKEGLHIELDSGNRVKVAHEAEIATGFTASDVLIEGDIIWVDPLSAIHVLAPSLIEPDSRNVKFDVQASKRFDEFLNLVRKFFKDQEFIEVRTPTLVSSPGLEPHLDPFATHFDLGRNQTRFFLPTSPEFHLKKMLSRGWRKIFEFKECFRNGELSQHHQPEFLMLEWYRAYEPFEVMIRDAKNLLVYLRDHFSGSTQFEEIAETTVSALFQKFCEFELNPGTSHTGLEELCKTMNIHFDENDTWDELFHRIFLEKIEPNLLGPILVKDFPPSQAALARLNSAGWADRFEIYWNGFEIANAFHELNDPTEQRRRFNEFAADRERLGKPAVPVDEEFLAALDRGMPPSVGIALGVERLFLAFTGGTNLEQARAFPIKQELL